MTQELDKQIVEKVCTGADQDVIRFYLHTPELVQMPSNGIAQGRQPLLVERKQKTFSQIQHDLPLETAPNGKGEPGGTVAGQVDEPVTLRFGGFFPYRFRHLPLQRLHKVTHFLLGADKAL